MNFLLIITQVAGILLLIATMILLFFRRIYLDSETKQPVKFSLPIIGEISTQAPVIVLVIIGSFMVVYPLSKVDVNRVTVQGNIDTGGKSVQVLVVADPDYVHSQDASGEFKFTIPLLATDASYRIKFIVDRQIVDDQAATVRDRNITLRKLQWAAPLDDHGSNQIPLKKDLSDEELRKISIVN